MKKLLSSIEFGKLLEEKGTADVLYRPRRIEYDEILSSEPTVGMFVPANHLGEPILPPDVRDYKGSDEQQYYNDLMDYDNACDRVIFEGFEIYSWGDRLTIGFGNVIHVFWKELENDLLGKGFTKSYGVKTLEDLLKYNLEVTNKFEKNNY